jgi:DNA-binding IclR family transcriptional regulator
MTILEAFSPASRELSLNELARRSRLPLSTTYRLARDLVEAGALERGGSGGYRIGLHLWEIGSLAPRAADLRETALPFMQDLYDVTHATVVLAVRDGEEALYVENVAGGRSTDGGSLRGRRVPLHATGAGKVLLAHAPDGLVDRMLAKGLTRYTPHTLVAPGHLRSALTDIRRTGVGYAREELRLGSVSVAAPVFDAEDSAVAALSLVLRSATADLRRLAPAVRTAATCASRRLREPPP